MKAYGEEKKCGKIEQREQMMTRAQKRGSCFVCVFTLRAILRLPPPRLTRRTGAGCRARGRQAQNVAQKFSQFHDEWPLLVARSCA